MQDFSKGKRYSKDRDSRTEGRNFKGEKNPRFEERERTPDEGVVVGRNSVMELLKTETAIDKLFVQKGEREGSISKIFKMAEERNIPILEVDKRKLDEMSCNLRHQGVIAMAAQKEYSTIDDILEIAKERGEAPFLILLDGVDNPGNLGAILRCAEGAGAHGVVISKRRCVGLTAAVNRASAGALEHVAVAKVTNLSTAIDELKEKGLWIYGAEANGTSYSKTDMRGPMALVMGSEGDGISRLVTEKCDFIVSIDMYGKVNSFNVSCAAAVLMCEIARQRHQN